MTYACIVCGKTLQSPGSGYCSSKCNTKAIAGPAQTNPSITPNPHTGMDSPNMNTIMPPNNKCNLCESYILDLHDWISVSRADPHSFMENQADSLHYHTPCYESIANIINVPKLKELI